MVGFLHSAYVMDVGRARVSKEPPSTSFGEQLFAWLILLLGLVGAGAGAVWVFLFAAGPLSPGELAVLRHAAVLMLVAPLAVLLTAGVAIFPYSSIFRLPLARVGAVLCGVALAPSALVLFFIFATGLHRGMG